MANNSKISSGMGLSGMIFIVFLILKLAGIGQVATWSWWWVTSPLWISSAIVVGLGLLTLIIIVIKRLFN
tara:strand:+ start:641 stop:850 length:210 start_codon:yes stop_codon:yes gene_type:complete